MTDTLKARIVEILKLAVEHFSELPTLHFPLQGYDLKNIEGYATRILSALAESGADGRVEKAPVALNEIGSYTLSGQACVVDACARRGVEILSAPNPSNSSNSSQPEKADCPECPVTRLAAKELFESDGIDTMRTCACGKRHERKREGPMLHSPPRMFLGQPDRWIETNKRRCVNGHVSTMTLKSEELGLLCLACGEKTKITFPEDLDGSVLGAEVYAMLESVFDAGERWGRNHVEPSPPEPPRQTIREAWGNKRGGVSARGNPAVLLSDVLALIGVLDERFGRRES